MQEWEIRCVFKTSDAAKSAGQALVDGQDPEAANYPWAAGKTETFDLSGRIDQGSFLSGGCPADVSVDILGETITLSFAGICPALQAMGFAAVAVSLLVAARIIGTGS